MIRKLIPVLVLTCCAWGVAEARLPDIDQDDVHDREQRAEQDVHARACKSDHQHGRAHTEPPAERQRIDLNWPSPPESDAGPAGPDQRDQRKQKRADGIGVGQRIEGGSALALGESVAQLVRNDGVTVLVHRNRQHQSNQCLND